MGKDYNLITLRSDDAQQIRKYPNNNGEKFRVALPYSMQYSWDHEVALKSFTYKHQWNQIGPRGAGRFYIGIDMPEPLFEDFDPTSIRNMFMIEEMKTAGIPNPLTDWRDINFSPDGKSDWWETRWYECEIPSERVTLATELCKRLAEEATEGLSPHIWQESTNLFGMAPLRLNAQSRGLIMSPNVKLYVPRIFKDILNFGRNDCHDIPEDDGIPLDGRKGYCVYGESMRPQNTLPANYRQRNLTVLIKDAKKRIERGDIEIDILCSLARPTHIINSTMTSTLYHFRREEKLGAVITVEPKHLTFLPLRDLNPSSIEMHIVGRSNGSIAVLEEPVTVTLLLQPRQHTIGQI